MNGFDIEFVNKFHPAFMNAYKYSREQMKLRKPKYGYFNGDEGLLIRFRFWGDREKVEALYSHNNVVIDGMAYSYIKVTDSIQAVIIQEHLETDLYDHWIQFV